MSNELDKIKQEIAAQYNKLNTTKESIMSARVSQTLTRIDTIMSQMSYRIDEESSAYEWYKLYIDSHFNDSKYDNTQSEDLIALLYGSIIR